ncbi:hypothetical protein BH10BAC3_BH10BAC3_14490 [soil metagenome]
MIFVALLIVFITNAQDNYRAVHWDTENGLSNDLINGILKDANGFLWIATESGLDRFDGNTFKNYFTDTNNTPIQINNAAKKLIEDSLHNIWIGTPKGMSRYDLTADTFSHFFSRPEFKDEAIMPFTATRNLVYCLESFSLITAYDIHTLRKKILMKLIPEDIVFNGMGALYSMFDSASNSVWMLEGSYEKPGGGLYQISLSNGERKHYSWPCYRNIPGHSHWSEAMKYDQKRNCFWINSPDGLMQFTLQDKQFHAVNAMNEVVSLKAYERFVGIDLDRQGRVWLCAAPKGMVVYDPNKQTITFPFSKDSVLQKDVSVANMCIYCDDHNMVWSGFWLSRGIYQLIPYSPTVQEYLADDKAGGLSDNAIFNCVNGNNGTVWMGTISGLNIFDPQKETFTVLQSKDLPGFKGNQIVPAGIDTMAKKIWLHSNAGLFEMDLLTHKCKKIIFKDTGYKIIQQTEVMKPNRYVGYCQYKNDCIIPVYLNQQLCLFVVNSDSAIGHQILPGVPFNYERTSVGFDKYLFLQTPEETTLTYINKNGNWIRMPNAMDSIKSRRIVSCKADSSFWIGSDRHLFHFDKNLKLIHSYAQKDGLPSVDMYSFATDNKGNIWFTTQLYISQLNIATGKITRLTEVDGFTKKSFSPDAGAFNDIYGDVYFLSGLHASQGFAMVKPGNLNLSYPPSRAYIQSIEVNQAIFSFQSSTGNPGNLSLKYFQNNISIKTGVIDYYTKGNNILRYKLEGLNNEWQYAPANYIIRYDGLPNKSYNLLIQASNAAGEFNSPPNILHIKVSPPFWRTWWFYALLFLLVAMVVFELFQFMLKQKMKVFNVRQKLHRDLHDDIGATLSSIKVYSEILQTKAASPVITELIKNNAAEMIDKLEIIAWATNPQHDSFKSFKELVTKQGAAICHAKNINMVIETDGLDDGMIMPGNIRQNLFLICKEGINNVIKHSGASKCSVQFFIKNRRFYLQITDDGKGFIPATKATGSGMKNMQKRTDQLKGTMTIQSEAGKGTILTVNLPTPF